MSIKARYVCFSILLGTFSVANGGIGRADSILTAALQGRNHSRLQDISIESVSLATPFVEISWMFYLGCTGRADDDAYATETASLAASSYLITSAVSLTMKYAIRRERPQRDYQPRLWNTRITPSFPSGHTAFSAAMATMAASRYPQSAGVAFLYATVSAYSQVYTGNHYLGDVLAGAVVGYLASALILRVEQDRDTHSTAGENGILPALSLELSF
ncbi:phosphatase PAP2 family protein [Candidatus Neomarinimicrobiota bacterium]